MMRFASLVTARRRPAALCAAMLILAAACTATDSQQPPQAVGTVAPASSPEPPTAPTREGSSPTPAPTAAVATPTPPPAIHTVLVAELGAGPIATATLDPPSDLSCAGHIGGTSEQAMAGFPNGQSVTRAFDRFIEGTAESGLPDSGYVAHVTTETTVTVTWTEPSSGETLVRITIINEIDETRGRDAWIIDTFRWCGRALEVRDTD